MRSKASAATQFRRCAVALGLLVVPLPFASSVPLLGACLFVSGCAISPTLVAAFARIEEAVPDSRLTEGITVFTTGIGAGLAAGAGLTGWAVDAGGHAAGFWVPVAAGLGLAALAAAFTGDRRGARTGGHPVQSGASSMTLPLRRPPRCPTEPPARTDRAAAQERPHAVAKKRIGSRLSDKRVLS